MARAKNTGRWHCEFAVVEGGVAGNVLIETAGSTISAVKTDSDDSSATRLRGLTIPGLANAHSHAFHRALRGNAQHGADSFWRWRERMYAVAARLDPDNYRALARAAYAEMLEAGITAVGEFHYVHHPAEGGRYNDPNAMGEALAAAASEAGIRLTILDTIYLRAGFDTDLHGGQLRFSDGDAAAWADRVAGLDAPDDVVVGAAIHSVRAVDPGSASEVARWAAESGAPLHFHLSEQPAENEAARLATGMSPTELLHQAGALGAGCTAVHATHLEAADVALLAGSGTGVCLCPTTERDLADGIGPSALLRSRGVPLSLGSDSQAVVDLLEEARLVEMHERLDTGERGHRTAPEILESATVGGMIALGRPSGGIAPGEPADFATIDLSSVRTAGVERAVDAAAYGARAEDVTDVIAAGRHIVTEGRHTQIDTAAELAAAIDALRE